MIEIDVPGRGVLGLVHLVLDVNGTIALDGELLDDVAERVGRVRDHLEVRSFRRTPSVGSTRWRLSSA